MKVLFIAPYVPSRIRIRPFSIIRELAKRHEVSIVALGEGDGAKVEGVEEILDAARQLVVVPHSRLQGCVQSLAALPTPTPMCAAYCRSRAMRRAVSEVMKETAFDVVHVEHLRAAHSAPTAGPAPVVFDSVDCLAGLFGQMARSRKHPLRRLVMAEEAWKLRRYEPRTLRRFDRVIITSESERRELWALGADLPVDVIPNGVDTEYFAPCGAAKAANRIVFSGKMSYHPNAQAALWFAENVMPAIRGRWPEAEFVIVGSDPPPELRKLSGSGGISVTGYVDDIRPYLDSSLLAVVPMQVAVGIQNKALEAMAMGLPVVASPAAVRPFRSGCPGIVNAQGAEDMTREVWRLMERPALAAELGSEARAEVVRNFSWQSSVDRLEGIYRELVTAAKGARK